VQTDRRSEVTQTALESRPNKWTNGQRNKGSVSVLSSVHKLEELRNRNRIDTQLHFISETEKRGERSA